MTLLLTPETETRLRAYAEKLDLDPEQLHNALLTRDLEEAEAAIKRMSICISYGAPPKGG